MKRSSLYAGIALAPLTAISCSQTDRDQKPNLLVIVVDQLRADAIGASGNPFIHTPNIDSLASRGAYFTRAYSQCAVSGPGRASLLTGLMVEHSGVLNNALVSSDPGKNRITSLPTYDQLLTANGYHSEFHGNWHSPIIWADCYDDFSWKPAKKDNPFSFVTDENTSYRESMRRKYPQSSAPAGTFYENSNNVGPYIPDPLDRRLMYGSDTPTTRADHHGRLLVGKDETLTAFYAREAMDAIRRGAASGSPFNITVSFFNPHPPVLPVGEYADLYDASRLPVPESISDPMTDSPYKSSNGRLTFTEYADPSMIRIMERNYYASVTEVDHWVGNILSQIDSLGLRDATMIVFLSDHGELLGAHGMRGKDVFYEEACRVPLIISFPGRIPSKRIDEYVSYIDLFPTIMDYLGIGFRKAERDGRSLRPVIEGTQKRDVLVTEWLSAPEKEPTHMVVKDGWKLITSCNPESTAVPALYNLNEDPSEMVNLIGNSLPSGKQRPDKKKELESELNFWLKRHHSRYSPH